MNKLGVIVALQLARRESAQYTAGYEKTCKKIGGCPQEVET